MKNKIIFLGSKPIGYTCLAYLISQVSALNLDIVGLLTNNRTEFGSEFDLKQLATINNIPIFTSLDDIPECDILYSVQYNEILKERHIAKAQKIALNLHMAPLPEYRGSNQFTLAILEEKQEFGVTIHRLETGIDNGDILFQKRFPIPENCWVKDLYDLSVKASENIFKQTLTHVISGNYRMVPQELLIPQYGTSLHYKKEIADLKIIDLGWDKEKIEKYIRATAMPGFEHPYCLINDTKVYFKP